MTRSEVARIVAAEIASYRPPLTDQGLVGTPWNLERLQAELELLRNSVVLPSIRTLHVFNRPPERVWLVAVDDSVVVYFDDAGSEYGLGSLNEDGSITDWGVYGDLVGTFMAR